MWETERETDAHVDFGTSKDKLSKEQGNTELEKKHSVIITGLLPKRLYYYKVKNIDIDNNTSTSDIGSFTTQEEPIVLDLSIADIRLTSALLTWTTNKDTTSSIEYGQSTKYGTTQEDTSGSKTTAHTLKLDNLKDDTTYNFRVLGKDDEGNATVSSNYTFKTLTYPKISNVTFQNKAEGQTEVIWDSNVPITSEVEYYNEDIPAKTQGNTVLTTKHVLLLFGLNDDTAYKSKVRGRDQFGNEALSEEHTFTTLKDTTPPTISEVKSESNTLGSGETARIQIIVSWKTDEPTTSLVDYGPGLSSTDFPSQTAENAELVQDHLVVLADLEQAKTYHFRVTSKDKARNETKSETYSTLTTRTRRSFLQIIIENLENTFSWIGRLGR